MAKKDTTDTKDTKNTKATSGTRNTLSKEEFDLLDECIAKIDELTAREPEYYFLNDDGNFDNEPAFEWEAWDNEVNALIDKYHDVIVKALLLGLEDVGKDGGPQDVADIIRYVVDREELPDTQGTRNIPQLPTATRNLLFSPYIPVLTSTLIEALYNLSLDQFKIDEFTKVATLEVKGIKIQIEGADDFIGSLSTSPLKLWDTIAAYLAFNNPNGAKGNIRTTIEIPLKEYAEVRKVSIEPKTMNTPAEQKKENQNARNRKSAFKRDIRRDLDNLARFRISGEEEKGRAAGNYENLNLIYPDHSIVNDIIQVTVPADTAELLLNSYIISYSPELLGVDDKNPNTYRIGRKMESHNSMDHNAAAGTSNTLKVSTLVNSTRFIPNLEELKARNQRNWKSKIKQPLEKVFKNLMEAGVLIRWEYRDPRTNETYNTKEASNLTPEDYWNLNVDFVLKDNPKQVERLLKKEQQKEYNEVGTAKKSDKQRKKQKVVPE